jgi:hypothetical protein
MTVEAQRPTGRPDTAPRGPAGPRPEPSGPKNPTPKPGTQKPPPASPKHRLAADLDSIVLLLRTAQLVADRKLAGADPALRMALADRLTLARRAVADLQSPARRDLKSVATPGGPGHLSGRDGEVAVGGGRSRPVQLLAGRPPLPGGDFLLPRRVDLPSFDCDDPLHDALSTP